MNDMYIGQSQTERDYDDPEEDPLVTENNQLTDRIAELTAERDQYKAALEDIAGNGRHMFGIGPLVDQMRNCARNALEKERSRANRT